MEREWVLKRNCALTPGQLAVAYGLLCLMALSIAAPFALRGMWLVLAFALLELGGATLAFLYYARHATDQEHVALGDGCLLVERMNAGRLEQTRLDPCWTKITLPARTHPLIRLESRGVLVEIGSFVSEKERCEVARELRQQLRASSLLA